MRGPVGSAIQITIRRKGVKKSIVFNIIREIIQIESVSAELIDKNIGYLRLSSFNENSSGQLKKKIKEIRKQGSVKGLSLIHI